MLKFNLDINKEFFLDSEQLANAINHDIQNIPIENICSATHNYDLMFIEKVLNAVEFQADIDRFVGIVKTCWKIDVAHNRQEVVKFNTQTRTFEPYYPQFEKSIDAIVEKISYTRYLVQSLNEQIEEWKGVRYETPSQSQTVIPPSETNQTAQPSFVTEEFAEYHLDDLPKDVKKQILIKDDKVYTDFVLTMCGPVQSWIDKHRLQDWNVVRFICRLRGIVAQKCSMAIFGKLLDKIGIGNQENNMKQRTDANDKNALLAYDEVTPTNRIKFYKLRNDGKEIEELLADVIKAIAA